MEENKQKMFAVKFIIGAGIQTQIQTQNVSTQEAIGLLEIAKDQLMANFRSNTKNLLKVKK
jgi:hypothetical protein